MNQLDLQLENIRKEAVEMRIKLDEMELDLIEQSFEHNENLRKLKAEILSNYRILKTYVENWSRNFTIIAPINGTISYLGRWKKYQFVENNQNLFAIIPDNSKFIGEVNLPVSGQGKVKLGQKVFVELANFPAHEFGKLTGEVVSISELPSSARTEQKFYLAKIQFSNDLRTTYKKQLELKPEMMGNARLITEKMNLFTRFFNPFKALFEE